MAGTIRARRGLRALFTPVRSPHIARDVLAVNTVYDLRVKPFCAAPPALLKYFPFLPNHPATQVSRPGLTFGERPSGPRGEISIHRASGCPAPIARAPGLERNTRRRGEFARFSPRSDCAPHMGSANSSRPGGPPPNVTAAREGWGATWQNIPERRRRGTKRDKRAILRQPS